MPIDPDWLWHQITTTSNSPSSLLAAVRPVMKPALAIAKSMPNIMNLDKSTPIISKQILTQSSAPKPRIAHKSKPKIALVDPRKYTPELPSKRNLNERIEAAGLQLSEDKDLLRINFFPTKGRCNYNAVP